jgi:hypothetical protein
MIPDAPQNGQPHRIRRFGFLQTTSLNRSNMIGIGPFVTIPALMSAINGGMEKGIRDFKSALAQQQSPPTQSP